LLLAVGYYMNGALNVPYYLALAANRPEIVTRLNVLALFATLPITVALTWRFGFTGAAASWVWYHLFAFTYVVPRICKHCIGIAPVVWFVHLGRVLALAAATYGTAAVVAFAVLAPTIVALATAYIVASIVFATASWFMIAPGSRAGLAELLGSLKGARSSRRAG